MDRDEVLSLADCRLCPRRCGVNRLAGERGVCGAGERMRVARVMLHRWEEPCVSGCSDGEDSVFSGSGAVFFVHCSLGCLFCQNRQISGADASTAMEGERLLTAEELAEVFLHLQKRGACNINLVTPTHYTAQIICGLIIARDRGLTLPVVWNTSGYESVPVLQALAGLVDVYLTDFKFASPALAEKLAAAPDYPDIAAAALWEMFRQTGEVQFDENGILRKGVLLRHLVLPGHRGDSIAVLRRAAETVPSGKIRLSLMRQYTPEWMPVMREGIPKSLYRRVTSFEYDSVLAAAIELGFEGYTQAGTSARTEYTPDFTGPWEV